MSHNLASPCSPHSLTHRGEPVGRELDSSSAQPGLARLGTLLQRAMQAHGLAVADCGGEPGLTDARFRILDTLSSHWGSECTQSDLATRLRQSESHLSELLEGLAEGGFISRERSSRDRRKTLVRVTPAGVELATAVAGQRDLRLRQRLEGWSDGEVGQLLAVLDRLCADLAHSNSDHHPPPTRGAESPAIVPGATRSHSAGSPHDCPSG